MPQTSSLIPCTNVLIALKTNTNCPRVYGYKPCMIGCKSHNHNSWACQPPPKAVNKRTAVSSCSFFKSSMACSAFRRSEEHTSELQSRGHLVCRLLLEKKNT